MKKQKDSSEKTKPLERPNSFTEMLTPSEIESLRKDRKEADKAATAYFEKKYGKANSTE